jgi:Carboxypeptidase regulatory-like domain
MKRGRWFSLAVVALTACAFLVSASIVARAADLYGSIRGTVTDPAGGAVPQVTVTATNMATNVSQQVKTQGDGSYNFLQLPIGDYVVKVEITGFKTFTASRIHLDVNTVFIQDVRLAVGATSTEITVQANQVQVETSTTQLGTVIEAQQITDLPLIGRDWVQLQALQPGVVGASDRLGTSPTAPPDFATNGGQSQFNLFLIDGADTNDLTLNTGTFVPSEDAIAEFRMVTSTLNPEYARTSGAAVNAVIKSGSNSFHGDAFDYYRSKGFDASNFFSPGVTSPFHENQFGGVLGGPIIKNHTFAFFSYQGVRESIPQTSNGVNNGVEVTPVYLSGQTTGTTVFPSLATSSGVSAFPLVGDNGTTYPAGTAYSTIFSEGTVPVADISGESAKLLKFVPPPNSSTTAGGPLNAFTFNATQATSSNQYLYRIDQVFNAKDTLWGTWFNETLATTEPVSFFGGTLPGFGEIDGEHFKFLALSWTHVINDHMLNELRGGYNRLNYAAVFPQTPTLPSSLGFAITPQDPGGAGVPFVAVPGLFNLGFSIFGPQPRIDQVYQGTDNFSVVEGRHTLKFGFDMRRWETLNPALSTNSGEFQFQPSGTYSTGVVGADFLLGVPALYEQASGGLENARTRQYYSYAQDEFKFRPNLTLTYGLGWTIDTPALNIAYDGHGQLAFRAGQQSEVFPNAPLGVVYEGDPGVQAAGPTQWRNFGPRVGFAYSPNWGWLSGGADKTSIRAGFGIYYDKSATEESGQVGFGVPPFSISTILGVTGAGAGVSGINPSFANPFTDVATGAVATNPYPFSGFPSTVNFATTPGLEPIFTPCCAVVAADTRDPRASNYNLTVERQVGASTIVTVGYVGSVVRRLSDGMPQNLATSVTQIPGCTPGVTVTSPPGQQPASACYNTNNLFNLGVYGPIATIFSDGTSSYNALQASINKKMSHGLQFLVSYTYSHSIDNTSGFENSSFGEDGGEGGGFGGSIRSSNPYCFPRCDIASSIYDARQRLVISYVYQIPGMRGNWALSRLTRGWTITGITTFQTGFPLDIADLSNPSGGCDLASDFNCWDGPNQVGPVQYLNPRKTGMWFNPSAFAQVPCAAPVAGATPTAPTIPFGCNNKGISPTSVVAYGNAPRNPIRGPGVNNWDFVLYKDTTITERTRVQLRLEAYNLFNHTQFDPNGVGTNLTSASFGSIVAAENPRLMQIAAKFIF